jgi:peptide/nickel transport system substrate-binding protein
LNPDPVGTGPFTVSAFSPQQVTLDVRDDYWGGKFDHLKQVKWPVYANEDAGKALVSQDKIDMATISLQDSQRTFVSKGKGNDYQVYSTGGGEALFFNCARAPFSDVNLRRAVSKAIDFGKVMSLFDVGAGLGDVAGMAEVVWGDYIAPEFKGKKISADPAAAKKALADGGWTVTDGKLVKSGKSYGVTLKTVASYTNWATWSDGIKQQLKDVLGIDVQVMKLPDDQYSAQETKGQFDILMDFGGGANRAADWFATGGSGMNKKDIVPIGQTASANFPRFSNDQASKILDKLATTFDEDEIKSMVQDLQRIYVDQVPFFVYDTGGNFVELNGTKWTGLPAASSKPDYTPVPYGGPDTITMLQKLTPSGN